MNQPNCWSCLPTAFSIVLKVDYNDLIKKIGHDGSRILWPNLKDPYRRQAFHLQELIYVSYIYYDTLIIPFEPRPVFTPFRDDKITPHEVIVCNLDPEERLEKIMKGKKGVILGEIKDGRYHATAWDGYKTADPIEDIHTFLLFHKIN